MRIALRQYLLPAFFVLADILTILIAAFFSLWLRFDALIFNEYFLRVVTCLPFLVCSYLIMLGIMHMYTRVWRYAGTRELGATLFSTSVAAVIFWTCTIVAGVELPRSFYFISYVLITCGAGLSRLLIHYFIIVSDQEKVDEDQLTRVLIVGAGDAGATIGREIVRYHTQHHKLVAFIDDDPSKRYHLMGGIKVVGGTTDIPKVVQKYKIKEIIIAIPSAKRAVIRSIVDICTPLKCQIKILPGIYQMLEGEVSVQRLRPIDIDDLLMRDEIHLDDEKIKAYLEGKCILVSGAGGSIGSEICRQVMLINPSKLILMGHDEYSIYCIFHELIEKYGRDRIIPVIASIRDVKGINWIFSKYRPQVVFHAAAYKHVPMMERQPIAAVVNNIFGTRTLGTAAGMHGVERFVMISTDKAVNPTSVMGATKKVAETVVQVLSHRYHTKYITVRFGNVLGSSGSVVPLFREQLAKGGPLTVTDPEMTRYFMTIPEASQLVLQAGSMGQGGEVFLLEMGAPVKIIDLARNMIRLSGLEPDVDIKIKITGLRPGEKIHEELLTAEEGTSRTDHEKIFTAKLDDVDDEKFCKQLDGFQKCHTVEDVIAQLQAIVPTYHPNHDPEILEEDDSEEMAGMAK